MQSDRHATFGSLLHVPPVPPPWLSQLETLQKEVNSSLRRNLRVYGLDSALLVDVGILLLRRTQ